MNQIFFDSCQKPMNVLLLRTPRPTALTDPYFLSFPPPYLPHSLSILSTNFINLPNLSLTIAKPANYAGVIITSPRAMEAWSLANQNLAVVENGTSQHEPVQAAWKDTPFFVVGPATKTAVLRVFPGKLNIFGEGTGSGQALGEFIVTWFRENGVEAERKPLLDLIGDKARSTIPDLLEKEGIEYEKLQIYETGLDDAFEHRLDELLQRLEGEKKKEQVIWMVFFSPSGSKVALEILRTKHSLLLPKTSSQTLELEKLKINEEEEKKKAIKFIVKFAVIGPTTKDYLITDEGYYVEADADSPEPCKLVEAILRADLVQ